MEWDSDDEGRTKRDYVRPRLVVTLAQLVGGVMLATAIIKYVAS